MFKTDQDEHALSGQKLHAIDDVNMRILAVLREDGRISMAALADRVNVSRASVYNRVEQLVANGTITGF